MMFNNIKRLQSDRSALRFTFYCLDVTAQKNLKMLFLFFCSMLERFFEVTFLLTLSGFGF